MLAPLLERAALAPHPLDHPPDPPVASTGDALRQGRPGIVPLQVDALRLGGGVAQQVDLALQLVHGVLAEPLERRVGFGTKPPRLTVTLARLVERLPIDTQLRASSAIPSVSSSVSVGRPVRK